MVMKVFIERSNEEKEVVFAGTVRNLLLTLGVNHEVVLVSRGNELLVDSDIVSSTDSIRVLSVVSGG